MQRPHIRKIPPRTIEVPVDDIAGVGEILLEYREKGYVLIATFLDNSAPSILSDNSFSVLHRNWLVFALAKDWNRALGTT